MVVERGDRESWNKVIVRGVHKAVVNPKRSYSFSEPSRLEIGYHVLDLNAPAGTTLLSTLPRTVHERGFRGTVVAVGSQIYLFGKHTLLHEDDDEDDQGNSSYFLDLNNPQTGWKRAADPSILNHFEFCSVVFQGRIFVFRDSDYSFICEVFDPKHNRWSRIKSPPGADEEAHTELITPVMVDYKKSRIIASFNRSISSMYAYYPTADRWECVVEGFRGWSRNEPLVTIAEGIVYRFYPTIKGLFRAYDLDAKQWLKVSPASGFDDKDDFGKPYLIYKTYDTLFHRGNGLLCVLASAYKVCESTQTQITIVHVAQFRVGVEITNDTKEVLVTPVSSKIYPIDSDPCVFKYLPLSL